MNKRINDYKNTTAHIHLSKNYLTIPPTICTQFNSLFHNSLFNPLTKEISERPNKMGL